jgi:hypothetical protein
LKRVTEGLWAGALDVFEMVTECRGRTESDLHGEVSAWTNALGIWD